MILYLASPHTFLNFREGTELSMRVFSGGGIETLANGTDFARERKM